jgi:ABC-type transport system substrate-binding protein
VFTGEWTVFYFARRPEGDFSGGLGWYYGGSWSPSSGNMSRILLRDLDNPTKTYNPITYMGEVTGGITTLSFRRISARRFSLTCSDSPDTPQVFAEIIIGEPDA